MKKIKEKYLPYLINSAIVVVIFGLILLMSQTFPFGDKLAIGKVDAIFQYKPMLYNFIMRIKTHSLYMYSFNNGLGNSFLFNFAYYLTSPFNLIALPFNNPDYMYLSVIIIKLVFTALTCTFYAKKRNCSNLVSLIVTLSYVFSSWFVVYYYNIMWLDTFMIFPLFQYGLEKLISKNKILVFIFSLAYAYVTNFYLSFSLLVYGLVYFIVINILYEDKTIKEKVKTTLIFLGSTIFSILIIAVYIHLLFIVKKQMSLGFSDAEDAAFNLSSIDFIKSLFYGNNVLTIEFSGSTFPNIATNTLILLSTIFYFLNSKVSVRDKVFAFLGIVLVIECLFLTKLDYIMHFFHNVVGLTYRYAFIFTFLSIILFIKNVQNYDQKDLKKLIPVILILLVIVFLIHNSMGIRVTLFNIISLLVLLALVFFYKNKKMYNYMLVGFVFIQCFYVGYYTIPSDVDYKAVAVSDSFKTEAINYRLNTIGEGDYLNKNLYTNQSVTYLFTSMTYNNVLKTVSNLGINSGNNAISGNINHDLFSLLFNVKNDLYLEKIYAANIDVKDTIINDKNVKENLENLVFKMAGIKDVYSEVVITPVDSDDEYYYYESEYPYFLIKDRDSTYPLAKSFKINKRSANSEEAIIYILNNEKLNEIYNYLSKNQIKYTYYRDDRIEGNINVDENQIIFTSIPYDENWIIKVDGQDVKPVMLLDSLIGIEVEPGNHTISMTYKYDFTKSIVVSVLSISSLVIIIFLKNRKSKKYNKSK